MRKEENKGKSRVRVLVLVLTATLLLSSMMLFVPKATATPISWGVENPYLNLANDFKVALHTHTTNSDGVLSPTESMELYESYGFVAQAITDHNMVTADPSVADIIYITSDEYSPADGHQLGINVTSHFSGTQQQTIDNTSDQSGLSYISHPDVAPESIGWTNAELDAVSGYTGIEIFNGYTGDADSFAEDKADHVARNDTSILFVAVDDSHSSDTVYRGWVEINTALAAGALTDDEIVTILASGNYLSMGRLDNADPYPASLNITVSGKTVTVSSNVTATIEFITGNGLEQTNASTTSAVYTATSYDDAYVRIKATVGSSPYSYTYSNPLVYSSTPYVFTGAVHVFTGAADALASNDANWNIVGDWTTHLAPPTDADIVFNATSTNKPCTWDLDGSFGTFFVNVDYTGTITQTANMTVTFFLCGGGTLTASSSHWINCSEDFIFNETAVLTGNLLRLAMTGAGSIAFFEEVCFLHTFTISGSTTVQYTSATIVRIQNTLTVTGTCAIEDDMTLRFYGYGAFSNSGEIEGEGIFELVLIVGSPTEYEWTPGAIDAPAYVALGDGHTSSTISLGANAVFGSSLRVYSNDATDTCTLSHGNNYTLSVAGVLNLGIRGLAVQGTGAWGCTAYVQDGVSSLFTQGGAISCGDWSHTYGTFTGSSTDWLVVGGAFLVDSTATITNSALKLSLTGTDTSCIYRSASWIQDLSVSGGLTFTYAVGGAIRVEQTFTNTGTITITDGTTLRFYGFDTFTNNGTIDGLGIFELVLIDWGGSPTEYEWTPGAIDAPIYVAIGSGHTSSTITLGANATFGSDLMVYSNDATNTCTLSMVNKSLSAMNISVAVRGVLNATTSIINCSGDWDSANGTFDTNDTQVVMYEGDTYAKLASGDWFDELMLANESIRLIFDTGTNVSFLSHPAHIAVQPSAFVTMVAEYPASDDRVAWEITTDADAVITYTISGMPYDSGYRCYQNDLVIIYGFGPGFEFSTIGGGEFEVVYWYERQISAIVVLTVNMIGFGIIVAVLAAYIAPIANDIKEKRPVRVEKLTQNLIRTVIFIVVASLMWGVLHTIAIG